MDFHQEHTPPDQVWLLMEPGLGSRIGTEVWLRDGDLVRDVDALIFRNAEVLRVRRVGMKEMIKVSKERREAVAKWAPDAEAAVAAQLGGAAAGGGGATAAAGLDDVRTLAVDYDGQGERFKPWRDFTREIYVQNYDDDPLEGTISVVHVCKMMDRSGGDPRRWLSEWSRDYKVERSDRTYHELHTLCECLHLAGTYDMINVGALRSIEKVARRVEALVEAYGTPGSAPSWTLAKQLDPSTRSSDIVAPGLRAGAVRRVRDQNEVTNVRVRGLTRSSGDDPEGGGGGGAVADKDRASAKKKAQAGKGAGKTAE